MPHPSSMSGVESGLTAGNEGAKFLSRISNVLLSPVVLSGHGSSWFCITIGNIGRQRPTSVGRIALIRTARRE